MNRIKALLATSIIATLGLHTASAGEVSVDVVFSKDEVRIIGAWYRDHGSASRKGGKKEYKGLPPGIAKKLRRGKPLPPGIAKRYLPDDLRRALPPPPQGFERVIIDGKVMLVEIATRVIHDILTDVVIG